MERVERVEKRIRREREEKHKARGTRDPRVQALCEPLTSTSGGMAPSSTCGKPIYGKMHPGLVRRGRGTRRVVQRAAGCRSIPRRRASAVCKQATLPESLGRGFATAGARLFVTRERRIL